LAEYVLSAWHISDFGESGVIHLNGMESDTQVCLQHKPKNVITERPVENEREPTKSFNLIHGIMEYRRRKII
jgi:hypothetical protein